MSPEFLLARLVSFPSVVGRPNDAIVGFVRDHLAEHGLRAHVIAGPEGDRSNLFATIGPADMPGFILSGHLDVVPADEPQWLGDPFEMREQDGKLIGRGTCDMKGFVAAVLSAVPDLVAMDLPVPIHLALSYDEEAGCRGVPHLLRQLPTLCAPALGCIVGEPSNLTPVLRHKGKAAIRLSAKGLSGHSSRPDLGSNAIHKLAAPLSAAVAAAAELQDGAQDARFAPPYSTLQVGIMRGGQAVNIIPESAEIEIEARAIPGVEPERLLDPIRMAAGADVEIELLSSYPPLSLPDDHLLVPLLAELTGRQPLGAVSYGTEAGLFQQAGVPSIICGPGDIARAHKPEEFLTREELHAARDFVLALGRKLVRA
ncbi:acetylornithine deacetylase [Bosea sp. 117]|uniref:acetylornithine deacetylase n=1 Tax=Bosea sp. 117 TaxID=1125973 RepID=UPI0004943BF1|nr:acetylornithine deacetylase [Bosea sp. 117]